MMNEPMLACACKALLLALFIGSRATLEVSPSMILSLLPSGMKLEAKTGAWKTRSFSVKSRPLQLLQ